MFRHLFLYFPVYIFLRSDATAGCGVNREGAGTDGGDVEAQTVEAERVL